MSEMVKVVLWTDRFGRVDIVLAADDKVFCASENGKIAEGVWCGDMGLLDFFFVAPFDNGMPEDNYRKLRDAVEETIERRFTELNK